MACISGGLNPPKTLPIISSSSSSLVNKNTSLFSSSPNINFRQISKKISVAMAIKQQQLSLTDLTNSDRRDEVMIAAKTSLSNCLSETNLHLTIPALKSKTRGKVW